MRACIYPDDQRTIESLLTDSLSCLETETVVNVDGLLANLGIVVSDEPMTLPRLSPDQINLLGWIFFANYTKVEGSIFYSDLQNDYLMREYVLLDGYDQAKTFSSIFQSLVVLDIVSQFGNVVTLKKFVPSPIQAPATHCESSLPAAERKVNKRKRNGDSSQTVARKISDRKRERNRDAAKLSRDKRKKQLQDLITENADLKKQLESVTAELSNYKNTFNISRSQQAPSNGLRTWNLGFFAQGDAKLQENPLKTDEIANSLKTDEIANSFNFAPSS